MNINFSSSEESYINEMIKSGEYPTPDNLVREAVRLMYERDKRLKAALEEGDRALEAGDYEEYTPELLERLDNEAVKRAAGKSTPNPDVCGE